MIGGGDSAMEEANFLTRFGSEVTLVHRREEFRASKIMLDRARHNPKIKFLTNTVVEEVYDVVAESGHRRRAAQPEDRRDVWEQDVDGFFVAIGHIPNTKPSSRDRSRPTPTATSSRKGGARTNIARRLPRRRRAGPRLPPGDHGVRRGLHGGHRSGTVSGSGRTLSSRGSLVKSLYFQVVVGIILGVVLGAMAPAPGAAMKPLGDGFIKLIKMIIAPIIFCTVVLGIAGTEDLKKVGRTGGLALLYFEVVSTLALLVGLVDRERGSAGRRHERGS